MENRIAKWLSYQPRTRLVFVRSKLQGIPFVNFGYLFAQVIQPYLENPILPMTAEECAKAILKSHTHSSHTLGNYVAIDNWAILLEPELKINLCNFLSSASQNLTIIMRYDTSFPDRQIISSLLSSLDYYIPS